MLQHVGRVTWGEVADYSTASYAADLTMQQ